ncbi:MAG: PD40 domain-containing protein [Polyangiaceae bacterium]|nr:PD40 domain-containing protein [Polyangiaceae bacterium]MCW5792024.1 PD40 domain-containing protein [Polyangiaceae bacterium]
MPPRALLAVLFAALVLTGAKTSHAGDPRLHWRTVETPRFRVHYPMGLDDIAQRVADMAEITHARLSPQLGWQPRELTHIVVTDDTDSSNGSANVRPYNIIRLFVSAPDDMSVLGDYDDWLWMLLTHEHTHVLHLDNRSGIPELLNGILGKSYTPNQAQPRWIIEGLAVALESQHSGAGRRRSSMFDMYLRADVISDNMARLDQLSSVPRRWPGGNLWYLYGGYFVGWILDTYGVDTFATVSADYGANIIPWGINRSIKKATGRTYVELYQSWQAHLRREYGAQVAEVARRGLREGARLTHRGRIVSRPRVVPRCFRTDPDSELDELVFHADDGDRPGGIYRARLQTPTTLKQDGELITRTGAPDGISFDADCALVYDDVARSRRHYYYNDLFALPRGKTNPRGLSPARERWTTGRRARGADVSPDGRQVVYVTNHKGTTTLRVADITAGSTSDPDGKLVRERALMKSRRYGQVFTPRFSPDGKRVAFSLWTQGGYRDIAVLDIATKKITRLTRDRAQDLQPAWSPDGSRLYFVSDRTGIANVYAYDLEQRRLRMVTNVRTGAYMPEPSSDGRTLYYVGYTEQGYDLYALPLDEGRFLDAPPAKTARPDPPFSPSGRRYPVRSYSALETIGPRSYLAEIGPGSFGQSLTVSAAGSDAVGLHAFNAAITVETNQGEPSVSASYSYFGLEPTMTLSAFRRAVPRGGFRYGGEDLLVTEHVTGISSGLRYSLSDVYQSQAVNLTYTAASFEQDLKAPFEGDPFTRVNRKPHAGFLGSVRLGFSYGNASGTANGISLERGFGLTAAVERAGHELGSDHTLNSITWRGVGYVPVPLLRHHVLALAASGGTADGTYPRRGLFATGGFTDTPALDAFTSGILQSSFLIRGYQPGAFRGRQFHLLNAEYRFPLVHPEFGLSTLPGYLRTLSAALFADYGGAFNTVDLEDPFDQLHLGVGAELWIDLVLGYYVRANLKLGYAHGLADADRIPGGQLYFVAQAPF